MRLITTKQDDYCTQGKLVTDHGEEICVTLELPWKDNQHGISCIPAGTYTFRLYDSPKRGYKVYKTEDVPNRSAIEIHIGNFPRDTDGCILVGEAFGNIQVSDEQEFGITGSKLAFRQFMKDLEGTESFPLTVER